MSTAGISTGVLLVVLLGARQPSIDLEIKLRTDPSLIVPGVGAESIVLGEEYGAVLSRMGPPQRSARFPSRKDLFLDVYKQKSPLEIRFDRILYYDVKKVVVFLTAGRVYAIAGLDRHRVTVDAVNLDSGLNYFIFRYGNEGLHRAVRGNSRCYIYEQEGIAVMDDGEDNIIDMYVVFPLQGDPDNGPARGLPR
jgi:hypothetical protein